jgi:hypothetical protein
MVTRPQRVFSDDEIHRVAAVYHAYRKPGQMADHAPGFYRVAALEEVRQRQLLAV